MQKNAKDLAINGGKPTRSAPFPPRSVSTREDAEAVAKLFDAAILGGYAVGYGGPEEEAYCAEFAESLGGGYADGVTSGSAAVYVALRALEIQPFEEIIVGAINDPGGIMPIALIGCIPVIADAAPGRYTCGVDEIAACITDRTRAILIPHIAGEPADVVGIAALAQRHGIHLVEDCAQAHGAHVAGQALGSFGDVATFSTMHMKHHNTGGQGGVVFTRDQQLYQRIRLYADRGKPIGLGDGATNVVASLNFNMDEIHAAIGRSQLSRLSQDVEVRRRIAAAIGEQLAAATGGALTMPKQPPGAEPSFWFLRLRVHAEQLTCSKARLREALAAEWIPLLGDPFMPHTFTWFETRRVFGTSGYPWAAPAYTGRADREFPCPNAHDSIRTHINLSINGRWTDHEIDDTLSALSKVTAAFRKDSQ